MALVPCPECGRMVSNKALSCPNCGTPLDMGSKILIPVVFVREKRFYGSLLKIRVEVNSQTHGFLTNGGSFETEMLTGRNLVTLHIDSGGIHVRNEVIIPDNANKAVITVSANATIISVQVR